MNNRFTTYFSQVRILQSRGMVVPRSATKALERENDYALLNGYKELFLDSSTPKRCKPDTHFRELQALYDFGRALRQAYLSGIRMVEHQAKSRLAYEFSKQHGADHYRCTSSEKLKRVSGVIGALQRERASQLATSGRVQPYLLDHDHVPLWVLINSLTFGTVSQLYSVLQPPDQIAVAKRYGIRRNDLANMLSVLTIFRNASAHGERIFTLRAKTSINSTRFHPMLRIPTGPSGYITGRQDALAALLSLKVLLPPREFANVARSIKQSLATLHGRLSTIPTTDVTDRMGFPNGWTILI